MSIGNLRLASGILARGTALYKGVKVNRLNTKLEIRVSFVERTIDLPNFSGFMEVIETACEQELCHYVIHWRIDEDGRVKRYAHQVEKEGRPDPLASIPYEIYQRMRGRAASFIRVERAKDSVLSLHDHVIEPDPRDRTRVTLRFRRRNRPYRFGFCLQPDGGIEATETTNYTRLVGERAREGHKRVPTEVCAEAYDIIVKHFAGCLNLDDHTQCELELSPPGAPK